ncbi:PDZ domain-containing protein, partial [Oceanospirillum sp. HFRX-1_2]
SLLTLAGLEMGDVILSVNGSQLGDPQSDAQLLGELSGKKEVEVMIQRGSRQFVVTFPITR